MHTVYVALGSNVDPEEHIATAQTLLSAQWADAVFSSVKQYPSLLSGQDDYLNAVVRFTCRESPKTLRKELKKIEEELGKKTVYRWGPRTIDLDLLLYDDLILPDKEKWLERVEHWQDNEKNELTIPHGQMHLRQFVLEPLCEVIDPEEKHPVLGVSWGELLRRS